MELPRIDILLTICLLLCVVSCNHAEESKKDAQRYETDVVSPELSHSYITSFAEDQWGHVWIGTSHGLNRNIVNGYHQYLASGDSLTLDDNHISTLLCDSKKRLWVASLNNHVSLLTNEGKFRRIPVDYDKMSKAQLLETAGGQILLNVENAVFAYDESSDRMQRLLESQDRNIGCFATTDNHLLVAYRNRLDLYTVQPFAKTKSIPLAESYRTASMRSPQEIWLSDKGRLNIFNLQTLSTQAAPEVLQSYISKKQATVFQVVQYDTHSVILNSKEAGAIRYNYQDQSIATTDDENYPYQIGQYNISSLFVDSHNNLWIGSDGGGYKVINSDKGFFHQLAENGFFNGMQITSLACAPTDQQLWIVAFGRDLYHYDFTTNKAELVWKTAENDPLGIKDIIASSTEELWITTGNKIVKARYINKVLRTEKSYTIGIPEGFVIDRQGRPWVLDRDGKLLRLNSEDRFEQVYQYHSPKGAKSLIAQLKNGNILLAGMDNDLTEISQNGQKASTVLAAQQMIESCGSGHFIPEVVKEDAHGNIWIGTQSDGVFVITHKDKQIAPVKGINCEEISSIEQDASGHVWIGTQYGLYECDANGETLNGFFKHDGLSGNSFSDKASACLADGTLVFGELQGITAFKPTAQQSRKDIKIVFEDLKINNKLVIPGKDQPIDKQLSESPDITLNYNQNNFSISYTVLDYRRISRAHYYYRLEGFERGWTDAGGNQEAFYSNIPAGNYTFAVKIEDHGNKGHYFTQTIRVQVKPAPWATWWAYLVYILAIGLIGRHYYLMHRRSVIEREKVRKAEEEKAQEQRTNEINKRYFANVAHQLRTPVTMISAPIKQLVNDSELKGQRHQLLQVVNHSVGRMLRLVNQLMDFNKLETDALSLRVRLVDITPLLQRTLDIYQMNAEEKGITFHTEGLDTNCFTYVDTDKLVNIVDNLLSNAIKFTPQGGQISLSMKRITREDAAREFSLTAQDTDREYMIIKVSDTGPGIPDEELLKVFERYYQVDSNQQGHFNWGTGIGLYYSLRLTELHHGHIVAENNSEGPGATFKFILPASMESYSEAERKVEDNHEESAVQPITAGYREEVRQTDASDMNKPRVLVVDDDTDISYYLRILLSEQYRVTCCYDVESAKAQMQEQMPDIIVSDVVMTGESGIDLCRFVKTELQFSHIPVILLTAKSNLEDQLEGIGAGADAYIAKPFNATYLLKTIETTLLNRERIRKSLTEESQPVVKNADGLLPQDKAFLDELYKIMDRELANDEFNVSAIVEEMHLSHSKFIYKVKGLTGLTPSDFFKTYKLNKAAALLRKGDYNISEVAYMTGFSSLAHFSKVFKKKFGVSPSQYLNPDSE